MTFLLMAIDLYYVSPADRNVLMLLRLPRTVTAMLAGAALSLAGLQMQSIFRNPIADPHIMGISSGAALGAAAVTLCAASSIGSRFHEISVAAAAFIGAGAGAAVIMAASKKVRSAATLLIFGVMLGFMANAIVAALQFSTDAESLKIFYSWSAGSFSFVTWPQIIIMAAAICTGCAAALVNMKGLDILLFGDEFAAAAGADPRHIRLLAMFSCCLCTGAVTAFCGPIGFAGIVAPHIAKWAMGSSSHRSTIAGAMLCGSIICLGADLLSQMSGTPLPVSGTMAFIGIPLILYILLKKPEL